MGAGLHRKGRCLFHCLFLGSFLFVSFDGSGRSLGEASWADTQECWPIGNGKAPSKNRSIRGLGLNLVVPEEWQLSVRLDTANFVQFDGSNGRISLRFTRQTAESDRSPLKQLEGTRLGVPWLGKGCNEVLDSWLTGLPEGGKLRTYRSVVSWRGLTSSVVAEFQLAGEWYVIEFQERWKKRQNRACPRAVRSVFQSITAEGVNLSAR